MLDNNKSSSDLGRLIAAAEARASEQQKHIQRLHRDGYDTGEALALLILMTGAVSQMREVLLTFRRFGREP
jgi:hypothetical protein